MKTVNISLSKSLKEIEVHIFSDLHIGDVYCNFESVKKRIEIVKKKDNAFAILNGDIMNNATKTSVSDSYAEKIPPMQQLQTFVDLFEPIKEKILFASSGNHENRTYTKEGIDLTAVACQQLGIVDRYCKSGGVLFLKVGQRFLQGNKRRPVPIVYSLYCTHGSGGGRKEGAKAIRLADMASIVDCDIYIHSHTHLPMIMKQGFFRTDMSNGKVKSVDKLFVNASAELEYGGYGQQFEYKPSSRKCPVLYLSGIEKLADARL